MSPRGAPRAALPAAGGVGDELEHVRAVTGQRALPVRADLIWLVDPVPAQPEAGGVAGVRGNPAAHSTRPDGNGWAVTWLPGRVLTRNQAITAMVLAETVAGGIGDHTDKRWLFIESWANAA